MPTRISIAPTYELGEHDRIDHLLNPVRIIIETGRCRIQDYITCEEAHGLAAQLVAVANEIEGVETCSKG